MQTLYESALKLKNDGKFDAARRIFEILLREASKPEDRAYLFLHLFACFKSLGYQEQALDALKRGYELAPEGSRFPLDAGIEEAVWHSEKGEYRTAISKYQDVLDQFKSLLSQPEERTRLTFVNEQLSKLTALTETSGCN
jgi:tetratricopeptide (TPR) repeat protein